MKISARVLVSGQPLDADGWEVLGTLDALPMLPPDSEWLMPSQESLPRPVALGIDSGLNGVGVTATFDLADHPDLRMLLFGDPEPEPCYSVTVGYIEPDLPAAPLKRRRLTGKAYRIARRRHGRLVRAWRDNGRPMREVQVHVPRARIHTQEDQ